MAEETEKRKRQEEQSASSSTVTTSLPVSSLSFRLAAPMPPAAKKLRREAFETAQLVKFWETWSADRVERKTTEPGAARAKLAELHERVAAKQAAARCNAYDY